MSVLLHPRTWLALLLAGVLAVSHFTAYRKGKHAVRTEWDLAVATANSEARKLEQERQRRADESAQLAAAREARIRSDAAVARRELDGMRDDFRAANEYAQQSRTAAERVAGVATDLLGRCSQEYLGMAEAAARSDNEARQLRQAWPTDAHPH